MTTTWPESAVPAPTGTPGSAAPAVASAFPVTQRSAGEVARSAGYAEGWSFGAQAAQARTTAAIARLEAESATALDAERARLRAAAAALEAAAADLRRAAVPVVTRLTDVVLDAALVLAEAVVGDHVRTCPTAGADALRRALAATADLAGAPVTVRMHPADLASLADVAAADRAATSGSPVPQSDLLTGRVVQLVADATLPVGDSVAEHPDGYVAVRLAAALDRAREAIA